MGKTTIWIDRLAACAVVLAMACAVAKAQNPRLSETIAGDIVADAASVLKLEPEPLRMAPAELLNRVVTSQDTIAVVRLRGAQLRSALERSVAYAGKPFAGFLQLSGLSIQVDPSRPVGGRVVVVLVGDKPLDPAKEYRVAMPRPLADGQLGYFQFWNKTQMEPGVGRTLDDAVKELASRSPGARGPESRIKIRNQEKPP
jgi:hypothetical protein